MPGKIILHSRRRNKFGAVPVMVDNILFRSGKEAKRWEQLKLLEKAGEIADLKPHPVFRLHAPRRMFQDADVVGRYVADFSYVNVEGGVFIVEDVKGGNATKTALYKWKKRHMELEYGIIIQEV